MLADKNNVKGTEHRSIFYELRDNSDLPSLEKSPARLKSEGTMLVMAGKESHTDNLPKRKFPPNQCEYPRYTNPLPLFSAKTTL